VVATGRYWDSTDFGGGMRPEDGVTDVFIASYGPDGSYRWDRTFGGEGADSGRSVALDGAGNVIIAGVVGVRGELGGGMHPNGGAFVASYSSDGSYRWDRVFVGTAFGQGVVVDEDGNVVVVGYFVGTVDFGRGSRTSAGASDGYVASYGPDGSPRWDRTFGTVGWGSVESVTMDADGNVVVSGNVGGGTDLGGGVRASGGPFVASYDSDGNHRWDRIFAGSGRSMAVAAGGAGHVSVTGWFSNTVDFGGGARTGSDTNGIFIVSLDAGGNHRWDHIFDSTGRDHGLGVAVDGFGHNFVTGVIVGPVDFGGGMRGAEGQSDAFLLSLDARLP